MEQTVKNHTMTIISWLWPIKIYFCDTWKSVQFFCLVKCLDPHKWWKLFPTNKDRNVLSHIGMVRPFCGFPMIDCYQDHGLLSSTHVLIAQSYSCIHGVWKILYGCCTVIWTPRPLRSSIANKAFAGCCGCSFVY